MYLFDLFIERLIALANMQYARRDPYNISASMGHYAQRIHPTPVRPVGHHFLSSSQTWQVSLLLLLLNCLDCCISSSRSGRAVRPDRNIAAAMRQHRPYYPRHLIGQCHRGNLEAAPFSELFRPDQQLVRFVARTA